MSDFKIYHDLTFLTIQIILHVKYHFLFLFCWPTNYFSVLKTFLHDPLVEWSKPVKGNTKVQPNETGEVINEKVSGKKIFFS